MTGYIKLEYQTKIEKTLQSHSMPLSGVSLTLTNKAETRLVGSRNVLGYIEGSDPKLKDEVIVIGAHLDHLGKRGDYIYNGSYDNGSGSVGVMEVAEALCRPLTSPEKNRKCDGRQRSCSFCHEQTSLAIFLCCHD